MKASDCILFSGGAPGAEAEFGACAERHGVEEVNFTFEGHKIVRHRGGGGSLNHEELQRASQPRDVSRLMQRRYTDAPTIRRVCRRCCTSEQRAGDLVSERSSTTRPCVAAPDGAPSSRSCVTRSFSFRSERKGWFWWTGATGTPLTRNAARASCIRTSRARAPATHDTREEGDRRTLHAVLSVAIRYINTALRGRLQVRKLPPLPV